MRLGVWYSILELESARIGLIKSKSILKWKNINWSKCFQLIFIWNKLKLDIETKKNYLKSAWMLGLNLKIVSGLFLLHNNSSSSYYIHRTWCVERTSSHMSKKHTQHVARLVLRSSKSLCAVNILFTSIHLSSVLLLLSFWPEFYWKVWFTYFLISRLLMPSRHKNIELYSRNYILLVL